MAPKNFSPCENEKLGLTDLGYNVTSSTAGIEILEIFRKAPDKYDLVITDLTMPDITGDKLAVELMSIREDIPIIITTGYTFPITCEDCKKLGVKGYLIKPLDIHTLSKTIRQTLDK